MLDLTISLLFAATGAGSLAVLAHSLLKGVHAWRAIGAELKALDDRQEVRLREVELQCHEARPPVRLRIVSPATRLRQLQPMPELRAAA